MTIRSDRDYDAEDNRHRRRMALMKMQGDINRAEKRNAILMGLAVALIIIALLGAV